MSFCYNVFLDCSEGSNLTPAHHFPDFRFKTYAPVAFRYFRELFGIRPDDYLVRSGHFCWIIPALEWHKMWKINQRKQRELVKSDEQKDVRTRINKHETGGWEVWSWEGRIEDEKLRRERKDRSAACHPSLGQRIRRLHDSSLRPELSSRTHTPCLVGIPACSMGITHQHTNYIETSCISTFLPTLFSPSVVTHHHMSTQKKGHVSSSSVFFIWLVLTENLLVIYTYFSLCMLYQAYLYFRLVGVIGSSTCTDFLGENNLSKSFVRSNLSSQSGDDCD